MPSERPFSAFVSDSFRGSRCPASRSIAGFEPGNGEPVPGDEARARTLEEYRQRAAQVYDQYRARYRTRYRWIRPGLFRRELVEHLLSDAVALFAILDRCGRWEPQSHAKLGELVELLTRRHPNDKVLIFSQFADTVRYLEQRLRPAACRSNRYNVDNEREDRHERSQSREPARIGRWSKRSVGAQEDVRQHGREPIVRAQGREAIVVEGPHVGRLTPEEHRGCSEEGDRCQVGPQPGSKHQVRHR
jgi:hypothetical protein